MLIRKDESEFEVSIRLTDEGEWEGRIIEYNVSRLMPIPHLHHSWVSLEAALAGMTRRWLRLFPDETPPDFHAAVQSESGQS